MENTSNIVLQTKSAAQTPLEREFARLLQNIEHLAQENKRLEHLFDRYSYKFSANLKPLKDQETAFARKMVLFLHARLQPLDDTKDLTAKHRQAIARMIVSMSHPLALEGDALMQSIHDQYSQTSMHDEEQQGARDLLGMMEEHGMDTRSLPDNASREEVLAAIQQSLRAQQASAQAAEIKRQAKRAARKQSKAASDPKVLAKLAEQEAIKKLAQTSLRDMYRQLARQLHPDRATSDEQRAQCHDLMSQVNAAYDKEDLLALLKLQLQAQQIDVNAMRQMAEDKLRGLTAMLRQQSRQAEAEHAALQMRFYQELALLPVHALNETTLDHILQERMQNAQDVLDQIRQDLTAVTTDAGLKRWVKSQDRYNRSAL